ncbi:L-lactate permease, partial [Pseudacidovorax intermedius]|uniref:L-lactate permease n=2 Tax=Pseudacidovorax TaxID=433923 RepID=UPI0026F20A71
MPWQQIYDPFGNMFISTALAAIPVVVMLAALGFFHIKAHIAAGMGLVAALLVAVFAYGMPADLAGRAALFGAFTGLLPIGWIVLNIIFLHQLTEQNGSFAVLQDSLSGITEDRRIQLLLIAFCFGAFFEGAAGFGTPVAVTAAILIGLGFSPLAASGLSLIANTAPVAFGALGTPVITLAKVHGYDLMEVTAMIGRQLPFFSLMVPFWLIWAFAGRKAMMEIWPAILVTGVSFAVPQFLVSNFIGPELVDIIAAVVSMLSLVAFLRVWQPKRIWTSPSMRGNDPSAAEAKPPQPVRQHSRAALVRAWMPWLILSVFVFVWGLPAVKTWLNGLFAPSFPMPGLHNMIDKMPPVVTTPHKEAAVYVLNLLSATGSGILLAAVLSAVLMKYSPVAIVGTFFRTLWMVRYSLLTIVLMLALGTLT